jgi:hypothetical protein
MFLPNEYLVYEYGKELQRAADEAALVRLVREDTPAPFNHWFNRVFSGIRRPQLALPKADPRQTAALRRV